MFPALDDVLQVDLAILILQMQAPARNLVDIRSVDRLLITYDPMQTGLGKLACPVALVVFEFGKRLQEAQLESLCRKPFRRVIDDSPGVKEWADAGHPTVLRCSL